MAFRHGDHDISGDLAQDADKMSEIRSAKAVVARDPVLRTSGHGVRVLVVEDDPAIADLLVKGLGRAGHTARAVDSGRAALAGVAQTDVVLLDLGLPDMDGTDVCRLLRQHSGAPVIVVTARGEERDRVAALDEGADDYLVKPFGLAELLARIRAVLRRTHPPATPLLTHGPLMVDPRTRRVTVAGREICLTPKEFDILQCLAADPGRVMTRLEILERTWDTRWYGPTKVLDVHVAALRKKLGVPGLVETVYGRGFRLGAGSPPAGERRASAEGCDHRSGAQDGGEPCPACHSSQR